MTLTQWSATWRQDVVEEVSGKQPSSANLTAFAALSGAADRLPYFTGASTLALATFTTAGRALVDDADAAAQRTTLGLGSAATKELTNWVAYTPTFTGFGTVSSVSIWSRRDGDSLQIRGRFTSGTSTATEARMTLGFNGTNGGLTIDGTKVSGRQFVGDGTVTYVGAIAIYILAEPSVGYVTFGIQSATRAGLAKVTGNALLASGDTISFEATIPISGW